MSKIIVYVANRIWVIFGIYLISLFFASWLFTVFEGRDFAEGIWWAVVTSLSIGYGDITPVTASGRILGMFCGHFWIFVIIPMIVTNIIMRVLEDKNEFTDSEQRELMDRIRNIEALLIKAEQKN